MLDRMQAVVGVFRSIDEARRAGQDVFRAVPAARLRLVSPSASRGEIALEDWLSVGLPRDELEVYRDALRRGRALVVALVEDDAEVDAARAAMEAADAESVDAARADWTVGLRDAGDTG